MVAMLRTTLLLAVSLGACLDSSAAQIYRCAAGGSVTYQELPCPGAASESSYAAPEYPPANQLERDRLLAREAALDARLVRRAEIDAQERMAREARRAREAELDAERERARAAEAASFYPAYPMAYPRVTHHRSRFGPSLNDQVMGTSGLQRIR